MLAFMVRASSETDAAALARLLHRFNLEFGEESPGIEFLSGRVATLLNTGGKTFLSACRNDPSDNRESGQTRNDGLQGPEQILGFAQVDFRTSVWFDGPVALLEELYVVPPERGHGLGGELMSAVIEVALSQDAELLEVVTGEDDTAARGLYESVGFENRIEGAGNASSLYYELDLRTRAGSAG
jgi:GNAT superfamily N-acetyltransferase